MSSAAERLPYPGLRSFTREETDIFFGREGCVDDMVDRLAATRFLAVLGASGSGKSSLVKTGLLDALEIGLLTQAGSRWLIADFRPGDRPIYNLAEGLIRATSPNPAEQPPEEEIKLLRAFLARGPRSVVEWCSENLPEGTNLLLLVDQFEELFRYSAYAEREEAEAFVSLLLESARAPLGEARIFVAITMRSEFLGAAALIDGLAEAINKGLYLTPRMTREQVKDAIAGPAAVCGFEIEPALVNRLLNDLTSFAPWEDDTGHQLERLVRRADQLPLMQHVLNRLWSIAAARPHTGPVVLKLSDYESVGGLRGALAAHGREILDELLPEHQEIAGAVFRALTAGSSLAEAVRRPTEFRELVEISGGDEIAVREIVEAFRAPGRNFLVPPRPSALRPDTLIDISHESLIRQWDEFAHWLQREITSADTWRRLVDAAERYKRGEANLLSGLTLASIANWWDTERPTAAWAKRYGGDFNGAAGFLAESRRTETAAKEKEADDRRQKSRNRIVTWAAIIILCVITPLTVFAGYSAIRANQEAAAAEVAREEARRAAEAERASAEESRRLAEEQRLAAEEARQAELKAAEAQQRAEAEAARADEERTRALTAQQEAMQQATAAEAERRRADEERTRAIAAQKDAVEQAAAAEAERQRADEERQRALVAQQEAVQQAAAADAARAAAEAARKLAEAETARADQERERAERARAEFQRANLQQFAGRVASLQQEGSWDKASNLLGSLWQDLIGPDDQRRQDWLIDPIVKAFARQNLAEFPIFPDFLNYSALTGWTGTSGRFRVYALDRKAEDGTAITGNKIIVTFDAVTGATLGSFELPTGQDLGSKPDLVSPDGSRVAIVTDKPEVALWAVGQPAPTLIPVPELGGEVGVSQLAPVHTDERFALYLTVDETPNEFIIVDPATQAISFTVTTAEIMESLGLTSVDDVKLLGLVSDRLIMLVNKSDGQVVTVDVRDGAIGVLETGAGVTGAELTQDGAFLLTLTCPGSCIEQHLTSFDLSLNAPLWVERVPIGMTLSEEAVSEIVVDGKPTYSVLVEQEGSGIVFQFSKDQPDIAERFDGGSHARVGTISFDAKGGFRTVESANEESSADGLSATGILAAYGIPVSRQKLSLYVAPNSVAVYQSGDIMRIAGVSYDGDLLVYRQRADGDFEDDVAFRPIPIAESNCLNSVAFGGDGKSLLFRHIDGSLLYVAAVGQGSSSTDWQQPFEAAAGQETVDLSASSPAITCDRPEVAENEVEEKLVAVDQGGEKFALLDKTGSVWWADVVDGADEAAMKAIREVAPLRRASSGVLWIAGDPARGRAALVTGTAVEIVPQGGTVTEGVKDTRGGAAPDQATVAEARSEAAAAAATPDPNRGHKLTRWGDPKAAAFGPDGEIVVAYGGGQITGFTQSADGAFAAGFDGTFSLARIVGLFASKDRVAAADDRDVVVALDSSDGALAGYARVPANPSLFALRSDGNILSVEYDTDSIAVVGFGAPVTATGAADAARLVTMRSLLDEEGDASLDSLILDHEMEQSLASAAAPASVDCAVETRQRLLRLEDRLLGASSAAATAPVAGCSTADGGASLDAAEGLARRIPSASVRELVEDESFSRLLQAAASGDPTASRLLGAVLARIAIERGELDSTAVAEETLRFGANLPATILKNIAAGAPISPKLVDLARQRSGPDPAAHQLVAHASERSINDVDSLTEALREFSIAERLYRAGGRMEEARFVAHRRAQLSRLLPDDRVLAVAEAVERWTPEMPDVAPSTALADLPAEPAARRNFNMENANKLAERVPDSLLLDALRTEMERARIVDLRTEDPQAAADLLIDLGRRSDAASGWSPDLVREYLDLAEDIRDGASAPSAFRLAAEALRMIGAAFKAPIHENAEASALFIRTADLIASTVPNAPRDAVAAGMRDVDLSLLKYEYASLPGAEAAEASKAGQHVLEATARMADAVAANVDDPKPWQLLRGVSLFWQGVLVNDNDTPAAVPILRAAVDGLRPAVAADPQNVRARFRFAEALRWVGLAETSSEEIAAVEREAVGEYQTIWKDHLTLDPDFAGDVGVGYGFALANLAQTMREVNLANVTDGKTADEHASWVLEILALAAEKDDLNQTMIAIGAATGDSTFVDGWYRMSSYGWALGHLSGLVNVESGAGPVTRCDVAAADPYDPLRRAPGVETLGVDAESLCRTESENNPSDGRALFQLARSISTDSSRESEYVSLARLAADAGVSPAFSLVASTLSDDTEDRSAEAYLGASQHTLIESFPVLYTYLSGRATTEREKLGLAWYAKKAAALGVIAAHVALADSSTDPLERLFRLELAARLADDAGDTATATELRNRAGAISVQKTDQDRIAGEVTSWTPEPLVELPASSDSS